MRFAILAVACTGSSLVALALEPERVDAQASPRSAPKSPAPRTPALVGSYMDAAVQAVPDSFGFHPFYKKYVDAQGYRCSARRSCRMMRCWWHATS